ncbi:MAG: M18 family aminopeptidase [Candidatus Eisenbacteria bacterium]|uniref:M18 family aminopeptidase n=1 Tax=Eiseniibacteriota bacterium TaxID=2212470 RepID=A0A938BN31_UNCEI|nr:M18 family aminopeptidase [Candidatus Eisenbacteria bacterium]
MAADRARKTTLDLMDFIHAGPTAAHAVAAAAARLEAAGFARLDERAPWRLRPGQGFHLSRGATGLVAGRVGSAPPAEAGFRIIGAHCDSPGLRVKPKSPYEARGYLQLGVEVYGGPLLASWADRDLTLAGRLLVRRRGGEPRVALVRVARPLCRIPLAAIHFQREVNQEGLKLDAQKHLAPILGLDGGRAPGAGALLELLAGAAGVRPADVVGADLELVDAQPPALASLREELFAAPRIDNLAGCHAALEALLRAPATARATTVIALFDGEEIGSQVPSGADSFFLDAALERLSLAAGPGREAWHRARAASWMVSVDGAHALHPNYAEMHDPHHLPALNGGPVIKVNAKQRYATSLLTRGRFEECAARAGSPVQHYVHRSDLPCGSTIGPIAAARLGIPTVDVGNPMLAMHSIRETGGVLDQEWMIAALVEHLGRGERRSARRSARPPAAAPRPRSARRPDRRTGASRETPAVRRSGVGRPPSRGRGPSARGRGPAR